jgi:hypothetical protein
MNAKFKIWTTLVLSVLLSVAFRLTVNTPIDYKAKKDAFWIGKTFDENKYNVLLLGDSRVYRSINPSVIEKEIPEIKVKNLGYSALGFDKDYLDFARTQLNTEGANRYFIIGLSPRSISTRAIGNESFREWKGKSKFEIWKAGDLAFLNEFFCPYTSNELFIRFIQKRSIQNYVYQDFKPDGFVKSFQVPFSIDAGLSSYRNEMSSSEFNQQAFQDLLEFTETCRGEGIQVIFFRPPTMEKMEEIENSLRGYDEDEIARKLIERGAISWQPISKCATYDASHLDFLSADKLSYELSLFLKLKFPTIRQGDK